MTEPAPLRDCPVCGSTDVHASIRRERLPVFQNVVYPSPAAARAAPQMPLVLGTCGACGFSFNAVFRPEAVVYDKAYDNHVASAMFTRYYHDIATMLIERWGLTSGTVYDVGCGKGEFLRILCALAPGIRGVGVDPSCEPVKEGNFELIDTVFDQSLFTGDTKLVILRHVLEHIAEPVAFLRQLREAMPAAPLYVEVPDLHYILEQRAFWDFCYEHCNYFDPDSLRRALELASFDVVDQQRAFGDQYQWALSLPTAGAPVAARADGATAVARVARYAEQERDAIAAIERRAVDQGGVVIWGMATKGTMLSMMMDDALVHGGIDANPGKQGRFAAGSGLAIHAPAWIADRPAAPTILAMNPNYVDEIAAVARAIRGDAIVEAI